MPKIKSSISNPIGLMTDEFKNLYFKILRFTKDNFRLLCEYFIIICDSLYLRPKRVVSRTCHFLICGDSRYVSISKYAVLSYLRHHSSEKVIIHCDKITYSSVRKQYKFFPERVRVLNDIFIGQNPYVSKGFLILSLQGTKDIFIDVDTRVNAPIPEFNVPTALVAELRFGESKQLSQILSALCVQDFEEQYLLNVTFVTWGGTHLGITDEDFSNWSTKYLSLKWEEILKAEEIPFFKRFVEQIYFSLIFQRNTWHVLKFEDRVGDKGIIESSYYGASGYRFGR